MEENSKSDNELLQELPFPKVEWKKEFWLTFVPYVISFILLLCPELVDAEELTNFRYILATFLLLIPIIVPLIIWLTKFLKVVKGRVNNYERLQLALKRNDNDIIGYKERVFDIVNYLNFLLKPYQFEVTEANYTDHSFFVVVRKNFRISLMEEDRLLIINIKDNSIIGIFSICNIHEDRYYAIAQSGLDPLWEGYVRKVKRVGFLPYIKAFYYDKGDNDGN